MVQRLEAVHTNVHGSVEFSLGVPQRNKKYIPGPHENSFQARDSGCIEEPLRRTLA